MIKRRKGFTIVELVIVIAVIAVLAAILIPTFSSIIRKANESSKTQLVRNINMALATNVEGHKTMHDALETVKANGYVVEKLTPTEDGLVILYDITQDRFILMEEEVEIYPKDGKTSENKWDLWTISDSYDATEGYSVYLTDAFTSPTSLEVTTGVDLGNNLEVTKVTYSGSNEVTIRTFGDCQFIVSDSAGLVHHYGTAFNETTDNHDCHAEVFDKTDFTEDELNNLKFAGGNGTETNPYLINSVEQLQNSIFNSADNSAHYKLLADIDLSEASCVKEDYGNIMVGEYLYNSTFDGNGYTISVSGNSRLFDKVRNSTIKNLNINYNNCSDGYITLSMYLTNSIVENVITEGLVNNLYPNTGLLSYNTNGNCKFINCVNNANITGYPGDYSIAIFGGALEGNVIYEGCINNGIVKGSQVGMFSSVVNSTSATIVINNCVNNGVINYLVKKYSSTYGGDCPVSYYVGYKCFQLASLTIDGEVKDINTSESIAGTGVCIFGTNEVKVSLNEDMTFTLTPNGFEPSSYKVSILVWGFSEDGSTQRYYIEEDIESDGVSTCVTNIKLLPIVNSDDSNYESAGNIAGNEIMKDAEGNIYYSYPVVTKEGRTFRLNKDIESIKQITILALNESGDVIGSGSYIPE